MEPCVNAGADTAHRKRPTKSLGPRLGHHCATCILARRRGQKVRARSAHVERTYGLSDADVELIRETMPENASGKKVCPGCRRATGETKELSVDHCHLRQNQGFSPRETVRGFLCGPCNQTIGKYSPEALRRLADYQEDPPAPPVLGYGNNWSEM